MVIGGNISAMPNTPEICKKKIGLMEQYADAAHVLRRSVERMLRDGHSGSAFNSRREAANKAKEKCDLASVALDEHLGTHNC